MQLSELFLTSLLVQNKTKMEKRNRLFLMVVSTFLSPYLCNITFLFIMSNMYFDYFDFVAVCMDLS